jgi:hypothetical protein
MALECQGVPVGWIFNVYARSKKFDLPHNWQKVALYARRRVTYTGILANYIRIEA